MKTRHLAIALLAVSPLGVLLADDVPKSFTFARYQAMMDRSPFAVATAVAAPVPTPNFAKDLYITSAARSDSGAFVAIASSADKNFKKYLSTDAPEDGYSITNVEWSDKVGATKVTISKDGQTATLTFNEALLKAPAANQPPQQQQQPQQQVQAQPIVPPPINAVPQTPAQQQPNFQQKPAPIPQLPTPPPRVRGVIPKNPGATAVPMQAPTVAPTPEVEL